MVLYLDRPRWRWRGRLWAHLISDRDLGELHGAARTLGLPWLSFGRDHYDIPDAIWPTAAGLAEVVDSRRLVALLRESGLRVGGGKPLKQWQPQTELAADVDADGSIRAWLDRVDQAFDPAHVEVLHRPEEWVVFHSVPGLAPGAVVGADPGPDILRAPPQGVRVIESRGRQAGIGIEAVIAPPDRFGSQR